MNKEHRKSTEFEPINKYFLRISISLFILSLFFSAYKANGNWVSGILSFALGWLACMTGGAAFSWLANPFLITAWFTAKMKSNMSVYPSILAMVFGLIFLLFDRIITNEGGGTSSISGIGIGYWLWIGSIIVMVVGNVNRQKVEILETITENRGEEENERK